MEGISIIGGEKNLKWYHAITVEVSLTLIATILIYESSVNPAVD